MKILVCNAGSTSLKFKLYQMPEETVIFKGKLEKIGNEQGALFTLEAGTAKLSHAERIHPVDFVEGIRFFLGQMIGSGVIRSLQEIDAAGFKTVLGDAYNGAHLVDEKVLNTMEQYLPVAPLHNQVYLNVIKAFMQIAPHLPLVAVFETAFHQTIPDYARTYGIPWEWTKTYGVRKYGFHGASHRYISERTAELLGRQHGLRLISCHLGGSSSLCAIKDGHSLETTQGFSPQSGITMGTRNGDIDVFIIFYLLSLGVPLEEIHSALYQHSGLLGISGVGEDIRELEQAADAGHKRAKLALEVYCYEVKKYIGAYWTVLGGADAIVFTGGIGENASRVRASICEGLSCFGIKISPDMNQSGSPERKISVPDSSVEVWVVPTNEELIVARETMRVL